MSVFGVVTVFGVVMHWVWEYSASSSSDHVICDLSMEHIQISNTNPTSFRIVEFTAKTVQSALTAEKRYESL